MTDTPERPRRQLSGEQKALLDLLDGNNGNKAFNTALAAKTDNEAEAILKFSDIDFEDELDFRGATFPCRAWFNGAKFSNLVRFEGARFKLDVDFERARFKQEVEFKAAIFSKRAFFSEATFSSQALFVAARFSADARFAGAKFKQEVEFKSAMFSGRAWFNGATFSNEVGFAGATFSKEVEFTGVTFSRDACFEEVTFSETARFVKTTFMTRAEFNSATFSGRAWFNQTEFGGHARFARVKGDSPVLGFVETTFGYNIPDFIAITESAIVDFDRATFHLKKAARKRFRVVQWFTGLGLGKHTEEVNRLRVLRGVAAKNHHADLERTLYHLERSAELGRDWQSLPTRSESIVRVIDSLERTLTRSGFDRKRLLRNGKRWWSVAGPQLWQTFVGYTYLIFKTVFGSLFLTLYRWSSLYGRSVILPLFWLVVATVFFYGRYKGAYIDWLVVDTELCPDQLHSLRALTLSNLLPVALSSKPAYAVAIEQLFCKGELIPIRFQVLSLLQGATTVVLLFLMGLGLRNFFRLK